MNPVDLLVIGAGPAGLAAALRFKQQRPGARVVVIEKAGRPGAHSLSGAVVETACLDELLPGWRQGGLFTDEPLRVARDEMYVLTRRGAWRLPSALVPPGMHHQGDHLIPLSRLVEALSRAALKIGVEVACGFSAASLLWEDHTVAGVRLVDQGRGHDGSPQANFMAGETLPARVTILADGARGVVSRELIARLGGNLNPQVYSIGVKQLLRLPPENAFGAGRVIHTLGYPSRPDVFGGGFMYDQGGGLVALGLILGLDWQYVDLEPQRELEVLKGHPFIARLIKGAEVVEAGAKVIPEGGFYALPRLLTGGALLAGDAAGFVNMERIKGIHYAILSGMAAADAAVDGKLDVYPEHLAARGVLRALRHARNFRQVFQAGLFLGAPLSLIAHAWPWPLRMPPDHTRTRSGARLGRQGRAAIDRATFTSLSGTGHREDEPSHLIIPERLRCARCATLFDSPCTAFCPAEVYRRPDPEGPVHIHAANCLHCGTCSVKCPLDNIRWLPPEGGEGPRYKSL